MHLCLHLKCVETHMKRRKIRKLRNQTEKTYKLIEPWDQNWTEFTKYKDKEKELAGTERQTQCAEHDQILYHPMR